MKIKKLDKTQLLIAIDRLTRFKEPEIKYLRVFKDLILSNLIEPKFKKNELDLMDYEELKYFAENVINYPLGKNDDYRINESILKYENSIFKIDSNTQKLIQNKINYPAIIDFIDENSPVNLRWLKNISKPESITELRHKYSLLFPIEKIVISEGITEEILLPKFAQISGYDFCKNGIYMISAGGKNQVVKMFYRFADIIKIPVYILLDSDAKRNFDELQLKLREFDKVHVIKNGEFEDILPLSLVEKSLNYAFNNISNYDLKLNTSGMVETLEEIFRHRGMHEFKKANFAHIVSKNIVNSSDLSDEILEIIDEIRVL